MANDRKTGTRPPDYLYQMALSRIEDLMVQAMPWRRIFAILCEEGYTESEATAKAWRTEVGKRWAAEDVEMRAARKDVWRARLEWLYGDLLNRASMASGHVQAMLYSEVLKVAKLCVDVDGVAAPITVRHEGAYDVAAMSPREREQEIQALLAKREAAQRASSSQGGN